METPDLMQSSESWQIFFIYTSSAFSELKEYSLELFEFLGGVWKVVQSISLLIWERATCSLVTLIESILCRADKDRCESFVEEDEDNDGEIWGVMMLVMTWDVQLIFFGVVHG